MATETKEELLENWYGWLNKRLNPNASTNKFYIKQALQGAIQQAIRDKSFGDNTTADFYTKPHKVNG